MTDEHQKLVDYVLSDIRKPVPKQSTHPLRIMFSTRKRVATGFKKYTRIRKPEDWKLYNPITGAYLGE